MEYTEIKNGISYTAECSMQNGRLITRTQVGDDQPEYADELVYGKLGESFDTDENLLTLAKLEVALMVKAARNG